VYRGYFAAVMARETVFLRTAYRHGILPNLLGARRVKQSVMVVPCLLGLSLPRTDNLHWGTTILTFNERMEKARVEMGAKTDSKTHL